MLDVLRHATKRAAPAAGHWFARDAAIMGTSIHVELFGKDERAANAAIDAVMAEMLRIDACMSPYKASSELSRINRDAGKMPVHISEEMFDLLSRAQEFARLSDGAFDITFAAAGHLYDYRERIRPSDEQLEQARAAIGWRHLVLHAADRTVVFTHPQARIDLGGFAKGHAVNNATAILRRHGVKHGAVAAGGDSRVIGDRVGRPWTMGVRDPRRPGQVVALLPLEDAAVSTSGDYERFFEADGERHHHVIDPRTGKSARGVHSVTVIGPEGLVTEALSKIVFVLGVEQGMKFVEAMPGCDAVVIDAQGRLHYSTGLARGATARAT
jgi:thiamine biosynthesis lipoprotein